MNPWYSLAGKTIWVTGGAGYLGTPITAALDAECAKVVCFDLAGKAEALVAEKKLTRTVPVTLDSRVSSLPPLDRYFSGSRKLWMPTCWIGTFAPWIASWAACIMSGSEARCAAVERNFAS